MKRLVVISCFCFLVLNIEAQNDTTVYDSVEVMPRWMGCDELDNQKAIDCTGEQFNTFLGKNLEYPVHGNYSGKIRVEFIFEKDGSVSNIRITKSLAYACDEEVIRVIKLLPIFIPAKQNGQSVRFRFKLPISFKIR